MRGTIIEHTPKRGKKTFGFSLFLGRDENGKQLRQLKRGFATEKRGGKEPPSVKPSKKTSALPPRSAPCRRSPSSSSAGTPNA